MVDAPRLRVVFFGTPAFAVPSLEALVRSHHAVAAVVSQPDRPKGRGHHLQPTPTKAVAVAHAIPVLQPAKIRDEAFLQQVRDLDADLGVVVAFGRILPDALLAIPRLGMINVHASVLPRYRGAAPIQRAVLAGDTETGVTIMRVERELDAGPTFSVATVPIDPDATSGDVEATLASVGADLLLPVVDALAEGRATETPQDHSRATHAAKVTKEEGVIDWSAPAGAIHNQVRGLQPWPLASTHLGGTRIVLRKTRPRDTRDEGPRNTRNTGDEGPRNTRNTRNEGPRNTRNTRNEGPRNTGDEGPLSTRDTRDEGPRNTRDTRNEPGTIVEAHGNDLVVACGEGTELAILELQPEGRRTMTAREFLAGHAHVERERFGT